MLSNEELKELDRKPKGTVKFIIDTKDM